MQIIQKSLKVKNYILRGLFSKPDDSYDNIVVMFHGFTGHKNENGYLFKQLTETLVASNFATLRYDFMVKVMANLVIILSLLKLKMELQLSKKHMNLIIKNQLFF